MQTVYEIRQDKAKADFDKKQQKGKTEKPDYPPYNAILVAGRYTLLPKNIVKPGPKTGRKAIPTEENSFYEEPIIVSINEKTNSITLKTKNDNPAHFPLLKSLLQTFLKERTLNFQETTLSKPE